MIEARILVSGRVQGVGYRSFVSSIARRMKVNGCVRNREDGNVEIVCECENESELANFMEMINRKNDHGIYVEKLEIKEKKTVEKPAFSSFFADS